MNLAVQLLLASSPRALRADGVSITLPARDAALLAWLAIEGPSPRARLISLLWPHSNEADARNGLRQRLFQLKRQFGRQIVEGGTVLALAPDVSHDLAQAGQLLGDLTYPQVAEFSAWLAQQRVRCHERTRLDFIAQCEAAERLGNYADSLECAQELLLLNPLSEDAHRRVVRLHYLCGDRALALLAFDRCEQVLKDEVGATPSGETIALLATINAERTYGLATPTQSVPASLLRPPSLVGRAGELHAMRLAWQAGRAFSLEAEAGMGKSRLLQEMASSQPGVVIAQARPGDTVVPYALAVRLLRAIIQRAPQVMDEAVRLDLSRVLPEVHLAHWPAPTRQPMSVDAQKLAVQRGAIALLQAALSSGVAAIVLDDLHFADDASLDLIMILARPGTVAALKWGFALRPAEGSPRVQTLQDALLEESQLVLLRLQPLTLAQVVEFVDSLGVGGFEAETLAQQLHRRTGGNPLFALETLRQVWLEAPAEPSGSLGTPSLPRPLSVLQLLARRIKRLSPSALSVARCAAVAGPDFSIDLAAHALGLGALALADPWAELEAAQVFRDGAFAHDLIYEAALASLPQAIAQHLHRDIAEFLQSRQAEPARLAAHWQQAQAWPQAGAAYRQAAQSAAGLGRHREEVSFLAQAAHCLEQAADTDGAFRALLDQALAQTQIDLGSFAHELLQRAEALVQTPDQELSVLAQRARIYDLIEDPRASAAARAAMALAQSFGRMDVQVQCSLPLAYQLAHERRALEAVALLEPLARWVHANQEPKDRYEFEMALAFALDYSGQLGLAAPHWDRARAQAERAQAQPLVAQALANKASTLAKMGQVHKAAELGHAAWMMRRAEPGLSGLPMVGQMVYAHRLRDLGRYAEALPLLEEALQCFKDAKSSGAQCAAEHRLAHTYMFLGQPGRAKALLDADADGLDKGNRVMRLAYRAELARLLGADAVTPARAALALTADQPDDVYYQIAALFASACLPPEEGEQIAASLAEWARGQERLGLAMSGHVRAAAAALHLHEQSEDDPTLLERAQSHARKALRLARGYQPDSFYQAEIWLVAAKALLATGMAAEARVALVDGRAWVVRVHATQVPSAFQNSFLERNPVNRELLALARTTLSS